MENQAKVKCPRCGSENVIVQNRGYSFGQGLLLGVLLVLLDWGYTIFKSSSEYAALDEAGQYGFVAGLLISAVPIFLFGLLLGLIGKNKLVARCLKCKNKFDPSVGIIEDTNSGPIEEPRVRGHLNPSKSDVREFQDKIKEYKKTHKVIDQQWIDSLIDEYNEKFNEDFRQYL